MIIFGTFFYKDEFQGGMISALEETGKVKITHIYREPHLNRGVVCGYYATDKKQTVDEDKYFIYVDHYSKFMPEKYVVFLNSRKALLVQRQKYCER